MSTKTDASSRARRLGELADLVAADERSCRELLEEQMLSMGGHRSSELLRHYDCVCEPTDVLDGSDDALRDT